MSVSICSLHLMYSMFLGQIMYGTRRKVWLVLCHVVNVFCFCFNWLFNFEILINRIYMKYLEQDQLKITQHQQFDIRMSEHIIGLQIWLFRGHLRGISENFWMFGPCNKICCLIELKWISIVKQRSIKQFVKLIPERISLTDLWRLI